MWNYRCDNCGCYLDPGEGRLCDDCREKEEQEEKNALISAPTPTRASTAGAAYKPCIF